ncbi:MAG: glycosyltransferase [Bacillus sp. (in: Bacteria)]|nr:glycosyltransferase [Bacillus sp. (in: firmicutes)]MCM1425457.1 glycosyltransferase [Eubacterium sp.]
MKKLLLIVPMLHQGGFEKVCVETARLLQPYYQVQIAIFDKSDIAYDVTGITVTDLQLPSREGKLAKIWNIWKRGRKLRELKKKEEITLSYSFGPTANLANIASLGKDEKWFGVRSYMDMGNPRQIKLFCRCADRVICCSEAICQEIQEKYHCKSAVALPNPFDIQKVEALSLSETPKLPWTQGRILVSMGREDVVKGFWHLIKSFSLVHKKLPDTKLMIIGQGEYAQYKKLVKELGIEEAVCFTGLQKNPYPYLRKSSLYVLTSYYEGFPNALVEAMALGVPAIATDCMTGPKEILGNDYGILIPNMSPEADFNPANITEEETVLAKRIVTLLEDEKQMEHYREMAKKRAGDYTTQAYVEKIRAWAED